MAADLAVVERPTALAHFDGAPSALAGTLSVWKEAAELANAIANTEFVPRDLRNKPAAVTAAILTGAELGLPPMASLAKIHVIEGRPGLSAEAMRALVLSHGHEIWADDDAYTNTRVKLYGRRAGSDRQSGVMWTMDMAKAARLEAKDNWRKYPRAMLLARATGELCRLMFADVLGGISYTLEEIEDGFDEPADAPADDEQPKTQTRKAAPSKKAAARKAAAPARPAVPTEAPLPPLPGEDGYDAEPAAQTPPASDGEEAAKKRAQQIAMRCQDAGLDDDGRHHLIEIVTNGRVASAKEVTAEEGADVLQAAREIVEGRLQLVEGDGGWQLVAVEDATGDEAEVDGGGVPDVVEADRWSGEQWRAYLRAKGVKVSETIREAQRLAGQEGEEPPVSLESLAGRRGLCGLVVGFVEDLAEQRGSGQ